jgi:protein-disulfide isomerase-like protein with CxxC motif
MQYHVRPEAVNVAASTTTPLRVVDAHSLLHLRASQAAKAVDAADLVDGRAVLQNLTLRMAATAYGVSMGSVARARRLSPDQRQDVRAGRRPLVLPSPAAPVPTIITSPAALVMSPQEALSWVVSQIGIDRTLNLVNCFELTNTA